MSQKYRYRDHSGGITRRSLAALKNLPKVGIIHTIRGYAYRGKYAVPDEAVMVKGENGTARFGGFCWGYGGEGPRGLIDLLVRVGLPKSFAEFVAYHSHRSYEAGVDWEIKIKNGGVISYEQRMLT